MIYQKPPLGLMPKWLYDEQRIYDILNAMERYSKQEYKIPLEWITELRSLIERREEHGNGLKYLQRT